MKGKFNTTKNIYNIEKLQLNKPRLRSETLPSKKSLSNCLVIFFYFFINRKLDIFQVFEHSLPSKLTATYYLFYEYRKEFTMSISRG